MKKLRLFISLMIGHIIFINSFSQEPGPFSDPFPPVACMISSQNNMLIDLPAGSKLNNTAMVSYEYNAGPNQFWCINKDKKGYVIFSPFSKKVLTVNIQDSTLVQQDFKRDKLQYWEIINEYGKIQIYNKSTNLFITNSIMHTSIKLTPKTGDISQKWIIIEPWNPEIRNILLNKN